MKDIDTATRQNMKRSRVVVFAAFFVNAVMNFVLMGIFARLGGLALVGYWAFLNAILLTVMIADCGATNALVFRIGREGLETAAPIQRRLLLLAIIVALVTLIIGLGGMPLFGEISLAISVTVISGLFQLASNWIIAVRMGQHEQYWFNVKTVLRVLLQSALAVLLYTLAPEEAQTAFACAFLVAAIAETFFALWLVRKSWSPRGPRATLAETFELTRGFGVLNVAQNGMLPLQQLIISALSGPAVLAVFAVASRVPIVITQSVSQALRALLPGLAGMTGEEQRSRAVALLRDAIAGQIILLVPALLALGIHAALIYQIWLGQSSVAMVFSLRVISLGVFVGCVSTPHFWAVQSFGWVQPLARATLIRVVATLAIGAAVLAWLESALVFPIAFALSSAAGAWIVFAIAHRKGGLVMPCLRQLRWGRIAAYCGFFIFLNLALSLSVAGLSSVWALILIGVGNIAIFGIVSRQIIRKALFIQAIGSMN
jgi:O-antigen/teichoic acid export membrane protein